MEPFTYFTIVVVTDWKYCIGTHRVFGSGQSDTQLRQENEHLRSQVKWLQQQLFGAGKTETISKEQLELLLSGLNEHSEHLPVKKTVMIQ